MPSEPVRTIPRSPTAYISSGVRECRALHAGCAHAATAADRHDAWLAITSSAPDPPFGEAALWMSPLEPVPFPRRRPN